ncbi:hypothetical protein S245_051364, partial [Arachis hypogaea]
GRVMEIYGPEASGKTTLTLHVISEAQKQGGYCVFVDAEHALDKTLAESIGVNTGNLLLSQPNCGEQALSLVDTLIRCWWKAWLWSGCWRFWRWCSNKLKRSLNAFDICPFLLLDGN